MSVISRVGDAQPAGTDAHLARRFLTADVGDAHALRGEPRRCLQHQASTCRCRGRRRRASSEPGTKPPPSTRSNSGMPVRSRSPGSSCTSGSAMVCARARPRGRGTAGDSRGYGDRFEGVPLLALEAATHVGGGRPATFFAAEPGPLAAHGGELTVPGANGVSVRLGGTFEERLHRRRERAMLG